ncbi:MAG: isochorismatase [Deltaproteobacteria bacterium RIFOXYD12_FULL_50_9]|nr:MAG: isochorismatase [Deltaproteobacteria bacterium RIFOXYD12_FULL_50_9]
MERTLLEPLTPDRTCLLVVDIQERLMPLIHGREAVLRNSILLVKAAKIMEMPVLATTQYVARIGPFLPELAIELTAVSASDKLEFDCFHNSAFQRVLETLPATIDTCVVCGVETHICIYQTMLGGLRAGYRMWVAADAVSARANSNHEIGLGRISQVGGIAGSTEMIIYELLRQAGTEKFKVILPFLK